jgi:hypothetical protein
MTVLTTESVTIDQWVERARSLAPIIQAERDQSERQRPIGIADFRRSRRAGPIAQMRAIVILTERPGASRPVSLGRPHAKSTAPRLTSKLAVDHGSISPFDLHNTLACQGPDFRSGWRDASPVGNIDIAPHWRTRLGR